MGFNIHILSGRNRSTNLAGHAALAASFNPPQFNPIGYRCSTAPHSRTRPRKGANVLHEIFLRNTT